MTPATDELLAMTDRERLAVLQSMTPAERTELLRRMAEARAAANATYGPAVRWTPDLPDIEIS